MKRQLKEIEIDLENLIRNIDTIIRNSDNYLECRELYYSFIKDISELFKCFNINTSLEAACLYDLLVNMGYFSVTKKNEWHSFKYDIERVNWVTELYGCRVITGKSVCRHITSMLTDLLNELGIPACNLPAYIYNPICTKIPHLLKYPQKKNHLMTGIVDENGKYIYDPTNKSVTKFAPNYATNLNINPSTLVFDKSNNSFKIVIDDPNIDLYNENSFNSLCLYRDAKIKKISFDLYNEIKSIQQQNINTHTKQLNDFRRENINKMIKIKKLEQRISPHSDKTPVTLRIK